jgi:phosphotriesterase-related protein
VRSFVDPCPMELARDPGFMAAVSQRSGVHVICATGLYVEGGLDLAGFPAYFRAMSTERIAKLYETELRDGIGPQRIRPGLVKCATGPGRMGANEERALRAGARAALACGVRVTTHTTLGTLGPEQLDVLTSEGLPPHHVIIGHCDWNHDPRYHLGLLRRGCYVGFDTVGVESICPEELRVKNLVELLEAGFERQLVISHDNIGCWHFSPGDVPEPMRLLSALPQRRYTYLFEEFLPRLRAAGVDASTLDRLLIDNPRRYFAGEKP